MTNKKTTAAPLPLWQYWRGLGGWNFYFLVKFALLWAGYLNFHPMLNLVFLAFLLVPIPREKLHRIRHWIAIPLGSRCSGTIPGCPGQSRFLARDRKSPASAPAISGI